MAFPHDGKKYKPGESGNPEGKPKGAVHWSTIVRNLLDDEDLVEKVLTKKPGWWDALPTKNGHNAIAMAMTLKAMGGDEKAAKWLRETGYGNKLNLEHSGDLTLNVVKYGTKRDNPSV